ncbi:MAG: MCP four helix bundle domain-containing protein [Ignavibacteriae bacterium]|nr:MCP four helix bundle domain-containing protein [Ignavibacteriota bacterium]
MLNNLKIGVRLGLGFGVTVLLLGIVIFSGLSSLSSVNENVTLIVEDRFPKTVQANEMINVVNDNARAIRNLLLRKDEATKEDSYKRFQHAKEVVDKNTEIFERTITTEEGKKLLAKLNDVRKNEYFPIREKVLKEYDAGNYELATEMLFKEFRIAQNDYFDAIADLIAYQNELVEIGAEEVHEAYNSSILLLSIIGAASLLFVIVFAWFLTKGIVKPVSIVKEGMTNLEKVCITNLGNGLMGVSKGDLSLKVNKMTTHIDVNSKDEIGEMAKVFNSMLSKAHAGIDAYEVVREKISDLSREATKLIDDAKDGKLDNRGDEDKFQGAYKEIIGGFNEVLDAVILPVKDGTEVLEKMAGGDLTSRVLKDYKGDHQKIKDSINTLGDSLENVLTEISDAVAATASAANQISSSAEELAAGSQEQSSQTSEVATAVEQMVATITQTTQHVVGTNDAAKTAGTLANSGKGVIEDTINVMKRIEEVVSDSSKIISELGESSGQIGEIVQVINDIADQTNLLALNAAIEAARAGEQGRGFAVVADEVRKLAERTTTATNEIEEMVTKIQKNSQNAVEAITKGNSEVSIGMVEAVKAGTSMEQIVKSSNEVLDISSQVATASEEQSATAEQISKSINGINTVAQESAIGIQQVAGAANDLSQLAEKLQDLVSQFKLDDRRSREVVQAQVKKPVFKKKLSLVNR